MRVRGTLLAMHDQEPHCLYHNNVCSHTSGRMQRRNVRGATRNLTRRMMRQQTILLPYAIRAQLLHVIRAQSYITVNRNGAALSVLSQSHVLRYVCLSDYCGATARQLPINFWISRITFPDKCDVSKRRIARGYHFQRSVM